MALAWWLQWRIAMRLVILTVLALAACGEVRQVHRWPSHRRDKDARIEQLELRVQRLESELATLRQQAAPPAALPALPSSGS